MEWISYRTVMGITFLPSGCLLSSSLSFSILIYLNGRNGRIIIFKIFKKSLSLYISFCSDMYQAKMNLIYLYISKLDGQ